MIKRRKRRKQYNWPEEIAKGNINAFYKSTDWKIKRLEALERDHHECQFFLGKWNDGKHYPKRIELIEAVMVHHIIPIKERPDLALDLNNLVSLSFEAHEIIEDRFEKNKKVIKKRYITEEKW